MKFIHNRFQDAALKQQLRRDFENAKPFPHIVLDNFLNADVAEQLFQNFPDYEIFNKKYDGLNERKAEGSNFEDFHPIFTELKKEIQSAEFCKWMTDVTGIEQLFVTDDALGSGLHQGKAGSFLDIHIDFSMHHILNVYRRLNLLIFFNKDWKDEWKGHTELWNADMTVCEKKVRPDFNRAIIFVTTGKSYHGYDKICPPENVTRKSFYAYFYTNENGEQNETYNDTIFKARPQEGTLKRLIVNTKEFSKNSVKKILHRVGVKF